MSLIFNQIYRIVEMLLKYTHTQTHKDTDKHRHTDTHIHTHTHTLGGLEYLYNGVLFNPLPTYLISLSSSHITCWISLNFPTFVPIIHRFQQFFQTSSCVRTELLSVCSFWLADTGTSVWRGPYRNVIYEFVLAYLAVSCMPCSSYFDDF